MGCELFLCLLVCLFCAKSVFIYFCLCVCVRALVRSQDFMITMFIQVMKEARRYLPELELGDLVLGSEPRYCAQ